MSVRSSIFAAWVAKKELTAEAIQKIRKIRLSFPEKKASSVEILFEDSDSSLFDSQIFQKNQRMTFMIGWTNDVKFYGPFIIKSSNKVFPEDGEPSFLIKLQDKSHLLNKKQKRDRHLGTPTSILKKIAERHNLSYDIEDIKGLTFTDDFPLIQANMTDAALIQRLADRYGYVWGIDGSTLYFRKMDAELEKRGKQNSVKVLSYRINDWSISNFSCDMKYTENRKRKEADHKASNVNLDGFWVLDDDDGGTDDDSEYDENMYPYGGDEDEPEPEYVFIRKTEQVLSENNFDDSFEEVEDLLDSNILQSLQNAGDYKEEKITTPEGYVLPFDEVEAGGDDDDIETDLCDGSASPCTAEELTRRKEAATMVANEIIKGTVTLSFGSNKYKSGDSVILAGVGDRLSGKYKIKQVELSAGNEADVFTTSLQVARTNFLREYETEVAIKDAASSNNLADWEKELAEKMKINFDPEKIKEDFKDEIENMLKDDVLEFIGVRNLPRTLAKKSKILAGF